MHPTKNGGITKAPMPRPTIAAVKTTQSTVTAPDSLWAKLERREEFNMIDTRAKRKLMTRKKSAELDSNKA
jgi:hypothetical protein